MCQVVESVQTANEVMCLARRYGLELPISENVQAVLHGDITPAEGLQRLLAREQKAEYSPDAFSTADRRAEARRVGKAWVSKCRSRGSPDHKKKKKKKTKIMRA